MPGSRLSARLLKKSFNMQGLLRRSQSNNTLSNLLMVHPAVMRTVSAMLFALTSIPSAIEVHDGLPRPDWRIIFDWVDANVAEADLDEAWTQLARDWLNTVIDALPTGYSLSESSEFMLVANGDDRTANHILNCCEHARCTILDVLAGVSRDEGFGKHVVLAFGDRERYYDYISDFYPDEGEFALSGAIFLDRGYGHFAMCLVPGHDYERTIAHELTHALMRHLPLPLWLDEGVTQVIEDVVVGNSFFHVDQDLVRRHREYWNGNTIHSFWSGDSFFSPDDGQELSYHLSRVLVRNLMSDHPKQVISFLKSANYADAGNTALLDSCGTSLRDQVTQFLGEGEWTPRLDYNSVDTN